MKSNKGKNMETKSFTKPEDADHVIVNISGGKDSSCLLWWACQNFPKEKIHLVHAVIDIDWHETKDLVIAHAKHFGFDESDIHWAQAVDKEGKEIGFLDILTRGKTKRDGTVTENLFPSKSQRWCTSSLKSGPCDKFAKTFKGNVLILLGERAEESNQRAELAYWRPQTEMDLKDGSRKVVKCSPILDWLETQVWSLIEKEKIPVHPCYQFVGRASCAICIFSSNKDIVEASKHAPDIVAKYVQAERKISHAFRHKKATKSTASNTT